MVFNRKPIEAIAKITSSRKKEERKAAMTAIEVRPTLLLDLNLTNKPADDTTCLVGSESTKRSASWLEAMRLGSRGWIRKHDFGLFQATNRSNACIAKCEYGLDSAFARQGV